MSATTTPAHVLREQRLAAAKARRGTPEWRAAGRHLVAERAQAEADLARARAEAATQRRLAARDLRPLTDAELAKAVAQCQAAITEACADHPDVAECSVAWDVVQGQVATMRPKLAAEVRRVLL